MVGETITQTNPVPVSGRSTMAQVIRFVITGVINTLLDIVVLNLLSLATGVTQGPLLIVLNIVSFSVAVINSYFLNKHWTFKDQDRSNEPKKLTQFLVVSVIGAGINSGILYFITTIVPRPTETLNYVSGILPVIGDFLSNPEVFWLNIAKVFAIGASMVWNFLGYKFFVFKK